MRESGRKKFLLGFDDDPAAKFKLKSPSNLSRQTLYKKMEDWKMTAKSKTDKTKLASSEIASDLLEEDGWLFRERPGIPVECVRRAPADLRGDSSPLYHPRHDYPST
jgi:hypothetical protein